MENAYFAVQGGSHFGSQNDIARIKSTANYFPTIMLARLSIYKLYISSLFLIQIPPYRLLCLCVQQRYKTTTWRRLLTL